MSIVSTNIKEKYLRKLNEFQSSNLKTVEQQRIQALTLLTDAFTDGREYIHFPIRGERASRTPMDNVFDKIQNNHIAIEAALAILVSDTNSLEDNINENGAELEALLDILETEITVRAFNTAGQETNERQIVESFTRPLTLKPESETNKTDSATDISWEPQDPNTITWIGDLGVSVGDPLTQDLDDLLYGNEIMIQHVAWNASKGLAESLFEELQTALNNITSSGQLAAMNDFFIVSHTGVDSPATDNPDGGGILKIALEVPELISHISLKTKPANLVDYVLITNYQGVPTMYQMIDGHVYIRPTVVQEIQFHITGGVSGEALDAFFTAVLEYIEVSGGSLHVVGYFTDRTSAALRNEEVQLSIKKDSTKRTTKQNKSAISEIRAAASKKQIPELNTDKGIALINKVKLGTAKQRASKAKKTMEVRPAIPKKKSAGRPEKPIGRPKRPTSPKASPRIVKKPKSKPKTLASKAAIQDSPRRDRGSRNRKVTPNNAKTIMAPPKIRKKKRRTPSGTKRIRLLP